VTLTCIFPAGDICGEGLTWDAAAGRLYWVDIQRFLVHAGDPVAGTLRSWHFPEPVVALSLTDRPGTLLVACASRLILFTPASDRREDLGIALPGFPEVRFNDGRCDPRGDFWIGSMGNNVGPDGESLDVVPGLGKLFRASRGRLEEWAAGIGISNTLCWSPDGATFYFGDTLQNEIRAWDYDPATGAIANPRSVFKGFDRGLPDGSAMDAEGYLWNCRYGGACVVRVAPDGRIDRVVEVPARNVTTCAFAGERLFITTAHAMGPGNGRLAGSLFATATGTPGLAENHVRIEGLAA
jgi:sugar lactone lactonase YvrE